MENECEFVSSRGLMKSCNIYSSTLVQVLNIVLIQIIFQNHIKIQLYISTVV